MKTEIASGMLGKVIVGIATAAGLAGGTAVIRATETNAVQEVRIERVERTVEKIDKLNDNLQQTNTEVAKLRVELERQRE